MGKPSQPPGFVDWVSKCIEAQDAGEGNVFLSILKGDTPRGFEQFSTMKEKLEFFFYSKGYNGVSTQEIQDIENNKDGYIMSGEIVMQGY